MLTNVQHSISTIADKNAVNAVCIASAATVVRILTRLAYYSGLKPWEAHWATHQMIPPVPAKRNSSCRVTLRLGQPTDSSTHFRPFPEGLIRLMSFDPNDRQEAAFTPIRRILPNSLPTISQLLSMPFKELQDRREKAVVLGLSCISSHRKGHRLMAAEVVLIPGHGR
jgi:hypothetical protein